MTIMKNIIYVYHDHGKVSMQYVCTHCLLQLLGQLVYTVCLLGMALCLCCQAALFSASFSWRAFSYTEEVQGGGERMIVHINVLVELKGVLWYVRHGFMRKKEVSCLCLASRDLCFKASHSH